MLYLFLGQQWAIFRSIPRKICISFKRGNLTVIIKKNNSFHKHINYIYT